MRVVTMLPDGTGRQDRYVGSQYEQLAALAPSPRGDQLVFRTTSGAGYAWQSVSLPDGAVEPFVAPPDVNAAVWSPRGNEVAWYVFTGGGWIGLTTPGSATIRRVTPATDFMVEWPPVWSPDGRRMVVTRRTPNGSGDFDLYVVTTSGIVTPLVVGPYNDTSPNWSAANNLVAFERAGAPGVGGLYVVKPDGSGLRLVVAGDFYGAFWSPDGKTLLAKRLAAAGPDDLVTVDVATSTVTPLATAAEFMSVWTTPWSPDGQQVLSGKYGTSGFQVLMLNDIDAGATQLTPDALIVQNAVWLP